MNPELDKIAVRLVAVDRATAQATKAALRSWGSRQKATPRVYAALYFADALGGALDATTVKRA